MLARVFLAVTLAAPIAPAPEQQPTVEALCAAEGGCVWVSQKWLRDRLEEAATAGRKAADIRCGRVL